MRPFLYTVLLAPLVLLGQACSEPAPAARPDSPRATAGSRARAPASPATCALPAGGVRLAPDTVAGLPADASIAELRRRCPTARLDTVGLGGDIAPALRIEFPGAVLWAVQSAYGDTLRSGEPPDFWAAEGDSLRFPDGARLPMTAGGLRALDSAGVIVVDHGDDTGGSYIVRCRFPAVSVIIDNTWPAFADSGVVPLARAAATDTTGAWRVEVDAKRPDPRVRAACARAPAT